VPAAVPGRAGVVPGQKRYVPQVDEGASLAAPVAEVAADVQRLLQVGGRTWTVTSQQSYACHADEQAGDGLGLRRERQDGQPQTDYPHLTPVGYAVVAQTMYLALPNPACPIPPVTH
jgi:hypothetical protein